MPEEILDLIIRRLSKNDLGEEETIMLQQWLRESVHNQMVFNEISDIWLASAGNHPTGFDPYMALKKVQTRIQKENKKVRKKKNPIFYALRIAAFALVLLVIGGLSYYAGIRKGKTTTGFTEIVTPPGSRSRINLPDGTQVWLNGGSNLKFNNTFDETDRSVTFTGEAYFEVKHNAKKPFVVNAGEIIVRVMGTAFNIKAYPEEETIETTLEQGSLSVEEINPDGKSVSRAILEPDQRAIFIKNNTVKEQLQISKKIDSQIYTSWKDNKLVFRNEPFKSLVLKLEKWYGITIEIEDAEINDYHFNGTFENETINDVLKIIHATLPIKYTVDHDHISISLDKRAWKGNRIY